MFFKQKERNIKNQINNRFLFEIFDSYQYFSGKILLEIFPFQMVL